MRNHEEHPARIGLYILRGVVALAAMVLLLPPSLAASLPATSDGGMLHEKYIGIKGKLEKNHFGLPIYLETEEKGDELRGDVYGIVNYPFKSLGRALQLPSEWCEITTLHLNIKGCAYRNEDNRYLLTLFSGSKHYQPPDDAHKLVFNFQVVANTSKYLHVSLSADNGPYLTRDYRIGLEAVALSASRTLIHFTYSYSYGMPLRMLVNTYFSTAGSDKVGFSEIAEETGGKPEYVRGVRGALERNAVRYYLALLAYMDTMRSPAVKRFERRIDEWFTLTERYPRQLHEIDREEYLAEKRSELRDRLKMEEGLGR